MTQIVEKFSDVNTEEASSFQLNNKLYAKDTWVKDFFVKHLAMDLKAVYCQRPHSVQIKKSSGTTELNMTCTSLILFLSNGNILYMENSEWTSFKRIYK